MKRAALLLILIAGVSPYFLVIPAQSASPSVVIILMASKSATTVNGSPDMPYLHSFAAAGRYFSNYAEANTTGPSLPDYLQVAAGSSCGLKTETIAAGGVPTSVCPTTVWNQLETAGVSWGVYEDGMPTPCASNVTYRNVVLNTPYALKHNPATPFASVWSNQALCQAHVLPFTSLDTASLPAVSFITPGLCNDQQGTTKNGYTNCTPGSSTLYKRGDDWLAARVPAMLAAGATVLITYDEGGTTLYAAEQGPGIAPSTDARPYTHYSVLAAVEDRYGLARLAGAIGAPSLPIGSDLPVLTGFNPSSGQVGDPVTITGSGFTGATVVTFGGQSQSSLSVDSDNSISTTVPPGALTGVICVTIPVNTGCSASTFTVRNASPIQHVVVILKENHSFDNYFGTFPGADGANTAMRSDGTIVPLAETPDSLPNDISHSPATWKVAYDNGKMDGFNLETGASSSTGTPLALSQMQQSGIPNYWAYASRYALADHFFASWKGASFTNNLYSLAAQAGIYDPTLNGRSVYWNPHSPSSSSLKYWGCDDPADTVVSMIDPTTGTLSNMFPCFNFPALPNTLANNRLSWHFYNTVGAASVHDPLDALKPVRNDSALWSQVVPTTQFFTDVNAGTLPAVSWIVGGQVEHPPSSTCKGENQSVSYVNAIMQNPTLWSSTAIFIVWDEWGGFYDHEAPPQLDGVSYGFRVPLIAISPYTVQGSSGDGGSVSSTFYSNTSILKFIEDNWALPSLTPMDASANDMMDMFNFSGTPKQPLILQQRTCPSLTTAQKALIKSENPD